jgi:hypothetical protein
MERGFITASEFLINDAGYRRRERGRSFGAVNIEKATIAVEKEFRCVAGANADGGTTSVSSEPALWRKCAATKSAARQ